MRNFQRPVRSAVYGDGGMIATSLPEATRAGVDALRDGGTAADAAIAASAVMAVAEPQNAGLGGDSFYIYSSADGQVSAYNGSGCTPRAMQPDVVGHIGFDSPHSVTVPGAVDAFAHLHAEHCRLPLARLLEPAITLAERGCIIQPRVAWDWQFDQARLAASPTAARVFGHAPRAGDRFVQPALARTLRAIARDGRDAFYLGSAAESIVSTLRSLGGYHSVDDFARHRGVPVTPIQTSYRGYEILECPPNGQGMTVLLMLNLLTSSDMQATWRDPAAYAHLLAQVSALAYHERDCWVADPGFSEVPLERLLSPAYADQLRGHMMSGRIIRPELLEEPEHKDTVYLACIDRDGNAVSYINSIFTDFGSAIFDEGSGLLLNNRGASFSKAPGHPNALAPLKRPMHTIIPGLAMRGGRPVMPFGVMGGHYQATGQVQVLSAMLDAGLDPQEALDLPRHFYFRGELEVEQGVPASVCDAMASRGYAVKEAQRPIGGGQIVFADMARGVRIGGTDPRKDGAVGTT